MMKKLYIKTYGCQMNVYDSLKMQDLLNPMGYTPTETINEADMVILNTCHIREKATDKVYSELGRIRQIKDKFKSDMIIVVAGCVGQAEGDKILKQAPWVNIVVGPQSYHTLPELILKIGRDNKQAINLEFLEDTKFDDLPEALQPQGISAFLTIQEGCDKFCKFCCVPYTRGAEFSRSIEEVYREARSIVAKGSKEITLLGQNVNAYHGVDHNGKVYSLASLMHLLSNIKDLERIRYSTSHPIDMTDDLIEAQGSVKQIQPYLHLPVQSGSDKILQHMNRKHDTKFFLDIVKKLRKVCPDLAMSSDFIVGYPGETEEDFLETISLVKEVGFTLSYSFKYSPRPGTPGSLMEQVPEDVKDDRLQRLQSLLNQQQKDFNESFYDKELEVLVEKEGKKAGQYVGKSQYMQSVIIDDAKEMLGKIVKVKITEVLAHTLKGKVIM
ncbi:MAG: tRNA (N6-isopentenyl adenosine(37)-C2)-methylthiotransferase MiaB [Rickettsiales bacterium]|nr:tRNA (N6-isopentenyl adenosine(37)-C2)-methylthiotransferase MiaB [Rickettsiales bacterium]